MIKNTCITVFTFCVLLCLSRTALACTCTANDIEHNFGSSYAAFTGKVIKIEPIKIQQVTNWIIDAKTQKIIRGTDESHLSETELQKVTFEVVENFKEVRKDFTRGDSKTIEILNKVENGSCGVMQFRENESYLIFGWQREPLLSKDDAKLHQEKWTKRMILQSKADKLNENLPFYVTSVCSRTNLLEFAKEDVDKVRNLSRIGLPR
jgi:hypothetical protein